MTEWNTGMDMNDAQSVLIISQDAEMTAVWETLFRQKNYLVINETSARTAVQTARLLSPSLIVLELDLPHPERLALCRELRATTHGTLLLLAPRGNEGELFDYHHTGVDEHLVTPVSPIVLLIKSMAWLVRQKYDLRLEADAVPAFVSL